MSKSFSRLYTELREKFCALSGEKVPRYAGEHTRIREEIVRCLWFGAHFEQDMLLTDDEKRMEVLSPGWWNVEGGPDFIRAEMLLEDSGHLTGDVEVHTHARAWWDHQHHLQPEYNNVVLHVVMWDDGRQRPVTKENGQTIPQLTLSNYLNDEVTELTEIVDMEGDKAPAAPPHGSTPERFCTRALRTGQITPEWLGQFLDAAGDHRLQSKARDFSKRCASRPIEEILYQNVAEALGYKNNRMPFLQLARELPWASLMEIVPNDAPFHEKSLILEAAFFGASGLLDALDHCVFDPETKEYVTSLMEMRDRLPPDAPGSVMSPDHWNAAGSRPVNHPPRRIAALARLCARNLHEGLSGRLKLALQCACSTGRNRLDTTMRNALLSLFTDLEHPYWSHRFNFHSLPLPAPVALVGEQRARDILTNVVLPMLLACARSERNNGIEDRVFMVWTNLPAGPYNHIIKRMLHMLAPGGIRPSVIAGSFRRQQGMQQIYNDCCMNDQSCQDCVLRYAGEFAL